ncbi:EpsG family protein [Rheinheimera sp.]|uniref:EpsG family protein n=1 Tax=Rheinheimera sp. TaxID=1869214 RepID=UPI00307F1E75
MLIALCYGAFLAALPVDIFADRDNYFEFIQFSPVILLRHLSGGIHKLFTNEPIWLVLNSLIGLLIEPRAAVRLIIFFSASVTAYYLLRTNPKNIWWLLLFLFFPQIIKNFVIHLRQGLAIAIFLMGWFSDNHRRKLILIGLTPFIHASFFFVLMLLAMVFIYQRIRFAADLRNLLTILSASALGAVLLVLARFVGARQGVSQETFTEKASGAGFLLWGLLVCLMVLQGQTYLRRYSFAVTAILFYLCIYFTSPVAGRAFESTIPLVVLAGLALTGWRRMAFLGLFVGFNLLVMALNSQKPLMGFAPGM